jgi:hypothetical protein
MSDGADRKRRSRFRPAPPAHALPGRARAGPSGMDMRHPSTPGDQETVRGPSSRGQITSTGPGPPVRQGRLGARSVGRPGCGNRPALYPSSAPRAGVPEPVDSALPGPSRRRYVRTSSSFPAFGSALPRSCLTTLVSGPSYGF